MVPQGPPTPLGGGQPVPTSLLRANSGHLGGQGGGTPSHNSFPSLVSPRNQFNNLNMIEDVPNIASLFHQSFGNGGPSSGLSGPGNVERGLINGGAESDPLASVGNGMGFNQPSSSYMSSPMMSNPNSSGQVQGQQQFSNSTDQQQAQQFDPQNFQYNQQQLQQFSVPSNHQKQQPQQQQIQAMRAGLGGVGPVKLEPQVNSEKTPQQLQNLHNIGPVKLEAQQLQTMRGLGPVKLEPQQSDSSLFLHKQPLLQQQQQHPLLSRQSSQAAAAAQILQQQRLIQIQQQQLLKSMPQQRPPLQPQFQHQNVPLRSSVKPVYEPGMCARRLTHYMYQQQHRPEDNSIEFWRKFVAEYFAPTAKKKWCVSMYGSGRQTTGVFPQDVWHCEICNRKPGRGFEATVDVLPRLFKIKYESGTLEELLYVDMPREYQNSSGQIVLDYAKAMQESVFEQLRVVRDGQLRIVFSPDLKICSWEFCARRHEELIPRRSLIPQVSQLGAAAQKCQAATSNASSSTSFSDLQSNCNMFVSSARQLAKALEVPLVNDLGYTKRYVRCLQISEVVNSMKDLIDYSRETGTGPMESLVKFPQRTKPGFHVQPQQQQPMAHNTSNAAVMQIAASKGMPTPSTGAIAGLLHQNSFNSRRQNPVSSSNGGNNVHMPSPDSSNTVPQTQPAHSPAPSASTNPQAATHNSANTQQPSASGDADAKDSQSSVQKILHDMMASQLGGAGMMGMGSMSGNTKNGNEILSPNSSGSINGIHSLVPQGVANGQSMNDRVGLQQQQQDLSNQLLDGIGDVNGFNDLEFDWKSSP